MSNFKLMNHNNETASDEFIISWTDPPYHSFGSLGINPQMAPELSPWTSFSQYSIHHCVLFQSPTSNAL